MNAEAVILNRWHDYLVDAVAFHEVVLDERCRESPAPFSLQGQVPAYLVGPGFRGLEYRSFIADQDVILPVLDPREVVTCRDIALNKHRRPGALFPTRLGFFPLLGSAYREEHVHARSETVELREPLRDGALLG